MAITAARAQRLPTVQFFSPENNAVGSAAQELRSKVEEFLVRQRGSIFQRASARLAQLQLRLRHLEQLEHNWDTYGAPPPNQVAASNAAKILNLLRPFEIEAAQILPSAEGGLAICFVRGDRYADIECSNDGEFVGVRYIGRNLPTVFEIQGTDASIRTALGQIRDHISG